ncbi:ribonuclease III [Candidatus Uhrbacteria bacterium]|nr:ribonuclease III [Candidatus Uhrbacteria bacterium]
MDLHSPLGDLERELGVTFKNTDMLRQALVHRSYLNEHPDFPIGHNERLEFLGDAVLELVVTEHLYQNYNNPEGELTNWRASLVNADTLSDICARWRTEEFLYLSRGEAKDANSKARRYILANACEAIIGAMYLDQGWEVSKQFILSHILVELPKILELKLYVDPKSRFQEEAQERFAVTPAYKVIEESGPDHAKKFVIGVYLGRELVATGEGTSKQEAQVSAAQNALKAKGWAG